MSGKHLISPTTTYQHNLAKKIKLNIFALEQEVNGHNNENFEQFFNDDDVNFIDMRNFDEILEDANNKIISKVLNLNKWTRCRVKRIERNSPKMDVVLHVIHEQESVSNITVTCHLQGPWANTRISIDDIVSLQAVWDKELNTFKVDKDQGFIVSHPDLLVSSTTVVGSLFCQRKAVLQERFRGIDANNKVMVVGSLVHELFQFVLNQHLTTNEQINVAFKALLESKDMASMLYGSCLKYEEIVTEIQKFLPNIFAFVQQYIKSSKSTCPPANNFQGIIEEIKDIEENLWVPQLGLKGKVDVSVQVNQRQHGKIHNASSDVIPLELKTGRATFSMEHKGQVILYQMMLNCIGRETNTGLLLYLREGIMREVSGKRNEQRDLIMLRNELAYYLSQPKTTSNEIDMLAEHKFKQPFQLPEPISHHSACSNCAYATICCTFAHTDVQLKLPKNNPLNQIKDKTVNRLQTADFAYFMKWCYLLNLEEHELHSSNYMSALWRHTPQERQQLGRALIGLQLNDSVVFEGSRYLHTFTHHMAKEEDFDFTTSGFSKGEYVIVSSIQRLAIGAGFIYEITPTTVLVNLERNLQKNYNGQNFILDKHESQASQVFNYTNLGLLLEDTEQAVKLRRIIVQKVAPIYVRKWPKILLEKGLDILKALNKGQRTALMQALTTDSCMLIKGLPGTGKTQTLVAIVRLLRLLGKSVLITSHTHSAVDNLLVRLLPYNISLLRLGSEERMHTQLLPFSEKVQLKDCCTVEDITRCYTAFDVVGVTCLGSSHNIFLHRKFDYCIVDEATQVMQCTVLRPLFFAEKFVLVGDPDQLPPLIRSREARQNGADESLFHRLDSEAFTSVLAVQYRMNKTITKLANDLTYGGNLQCANETVKQAHIKLNKNITEKWLQKALHNNIDLAVFVLDTLDCAERSLSYAATRLCANIKAKHQGAEIDNIDEIFNRKKKSLNKYMNYCDAGIIYYIVRVLLGAGYDASAIGIVAPYRAQVELLQHIKNQHELHEPKLNYNALEVNTVDQYQGRDKDIIIYSGARTGPLSDPNTERLRELDILEDKRRLTVAITRAKYKLILVGDVKCLTQYSTFRELFMHVPSRCKLSLEDNKLDFSWSKIFVELDKILTT